MKPTTRLLIGAPLTGEEARFLRRLHADLDGMEALILANFETPRRQIDFFIVTAIYAALLELKGFKLAIFGEQNGIWTYETSGGQRLRYAGENPWQQTRDEKYALSDEMLKFQRQHPDVPAAGGRGYFTQFDAFVCVFPAIHCDSKVTRGDHKVTVASYPEVLDAIRSKSLSSTWSMNDWQKFAEQHLNLYSTTLDRATCPAINGASETLLTYRTRLRSVIGTSLPPLFSIPEETAYGQALLSQLLEPRNFILLGPSGSSKTFHLHHLVLQIVTKEEEIPLLIEAKRYRGGDFWTVLRHATAPLFRGDPKELLDAIKLCGLKPVVLVDALNECGESARTDLLRGIQSFIVQYEGRVIFSSQERINLPGDIAAECKSLLLPRGGHKRAIYAYHAGISPEPDLDRLCGEFSNAYDLTIAGRCHGSLAGGPESRADLYDRYVRKCIPTKTTTVIGLLRAVAAEMNSKFSLALHRDEFEGIAEQFLAEQKAPLSIVDELRGSRLVQITDDALTFEHEQLLNFFKAESLRRQFTDVTQLSAELARPCHQNLIEFILPRFSSSKDLSNLISAAGDAEFLSAVLRGRCGSTAQKVLLTQCELLLDDAAQDLPNLQIECQTVQVEDGRSRLANLELTGHRDWGTFSAILCRAIALNIGNASLRLKFLELLDLTECSLRTCARKAAKAFGFRPGPIWCETVRLYGGALQHSTLKIPCCAILSILRTVQMFPRRFKQGLPIDDQLLERARRTPESHLSMLALLEDLQHGESPLDIPTKLDLIRRACDSDVYILKVDALQLLERMSREVHEQRPEELPSISALLEGFKSDNIMLNTALVETLVAYDLVEPPVSLDSALCECRAVINPAAASDPATIEIASLSKVSVEQLLSDQAYSILAKIFEDVFQGIYFDAYSSLDDEDKGSLLCLAANTSRPGLFTDWVFRELLRYGGRKAEPIYERFASAPHRNNFSPQEAVATFVLAVQGCAKLDRLLPPLRENQSPEVEAWRLIGEILYLCECQLPVPDDIWKRFAGRAGLAAADALYQLHRSQWHAGDQQDASDLALRFLQQFRPIIEDCLRHRDALPSIFPHGGSRDADVIRFLISRLGLAGDEGSIAILRPMADDRVFGKDAVTAIASIQRRRSQSMMYPCP